MLRNEAAWPWETTPDVDPAAAAAAAAEAGGPATDEDAAETPTPLSPRLHAAAADALATRPAITAARMGER